MNISYEGIGQLAVTFPAGDCVEGNVCMLDNYGRAADCVECDCFIGKVQSVKNGMACVILEGFVTVGYTGSTPSYGVCCMLADGNGGVMCEDEAPEYLVVAVDTASKTCVIKL